MTEITRVPLSPLAKGSLTKLWLGVGVALALGGGIAWAQKPATGAAGAAAGVAGAASSAAVKVNTEVAGHGASPTVDDFVLISYKGTLASNGQVFDQNTGAAFPVSGVIPGFTQALLQMQRGGHYKVFIPAALGYGDKVTGPIPANSDLIFERSLIDFKSRAELEAAQRQANARRAGGGGEGPGDPAVLPQGGAVPPHP